MPVHYSTKNCGSFYVDSSEHIDCKCLMNINGVCHRKSMQDLAKQMIKDGNDDYVGQCYYHENYLMASEFRLKSKLI